MNENNTEPTLEPLIGHPGPPPLRIHHIMAATVVIAVLLTLGQSLHQVAGLNISNSFESPAGVFSVVSTGIAITLIGFGFAWRRGGFAFPSQPGHWLLLLNAAVPLMYYAALAIAQLLTWSGWPVTPGMFFGCYRWLWFAAMTTIYLLAARRITDSRAWRVYFIVRCFLSAVMFLFPAFLFPLLFINELYKKISPTVASSLVVLLVASSCILAAVFSDHRADRRRDWIHWIGVALTLLSIFTFIITAVVQLWVFGHGGS